MTDYSKLMARYKEAENDLRAILEEINLLKADRARLEWLLSHEGGAWSFWAQSQGHWRPNLAANREAIDAARKGEP